jgi:hypothetical protein
LLAYLSVSIFLEKDFEEQWQQLAVNIKTDLKTHSNMTQEDVE